MVCRVADSQSGLQWRRWLGYLLAVVVWVGIAWGWMPAIAPLEGTAQAADYNREALLERDFSNQDLTDSSFTKANLRQSNFSHSNLQGVSFFGANLERVNLEGADLRNATLDSARLVDANLMNAVLEGAFAFNAQFDRAMIDGADFTDVLLRDDVQQKLCKSATGTNPTTGRQTAESLECF